MFHRKKLEDYKILKELVPSEKDTFHTVIKIAQKKPAKKRKRYTSIWYIKTDLEKHEAIIETIAQELFRLILPRQPKVRLLENLDKVAVKSVAGYYSCDNMDDQDFKSYVHAHQMTGLGEIMVLALWCNEIDFKMPNLCINYHNKLIKIDGDLCFASFTMPFDTYRKKITQDDLYTLPLIFDYESYHWLEQITATSKCYDLKKLECWSNISSDERFRAEVNATVMKITLLPDELIYEFIATYIGDQTQEMNNLYQEIILRKRQLFDAAQGNESYQAYLTSRQSEVDLVQYMRYLKSFKMVGKVHLSMNKYENIIYQYYDELKVNCKNKMKY